MFRRLLFTLMLAPTLLPALEIIAHRGASADAPENTLSAMKLAWEQQADAAELDLWLSKDGHLVVFHDADTKRFEAHPRRIPEMTWEEIQTLDVGAWKAPQFKGERVPELPAILATIPEGKRIVLELKAGPEIVPEFVKVLKASALKPEKMCVISFQFDALKESKILLPDVPHYLLKSFKEGASSDLGFLILQAKAAHFQGLNLQSTWPITPEFTAQVKAAGLQLLVWTVDDPVVARRLSAAGVDAITTNKPAWLREQLKSAAP